MYLHITITVTLGGNWGVYISIIYDNFTRQMVCPADCSHICLDIVISRILHSSIVTRSVDKYRIYDYILWNNLKYNTSFKKIQSNLSNVVTSIKQSLVLKCHLLLFLSYKISYNWTSFMRSPVWEDHFLCPKCDIIRRVWRYQRDNQNPYIEEEHTKQWPKEKVQRTNNDL